MSKTYIVGNNSHEFPSQGDGNWGEEVTAWAGSVTDVLANLQGPNDVLVTSAALLNNQSSPVNVIGLSFTTTEVLSVEISYFIKREGSSIATENGRILANYDGSTWKYTQEGVGDTGIVFSLNASGQVQYISSDFAGHTQSSVRFRAKTIDQP